MMSDIEKRFPFDAYPKGWFQVAYSREVDRGSDRGPALFRQTTDLLPRRLRQPVRARRILPPSGCRYRRRRHRHRGLHHLPVPRLAVRRRRIECRDPVCEDPQSHRAAAGVADGRARRYDIRLAFARRRPNPEWELPKIPEARTPRSPSTRPNTPAGCSGPIRRRYSKTPSTSHISRPCTGSRRSATSTGDTTGTGCRAVAEVTFQTPRGPVSGAVDSELFGMGIDVVQAPWPRPFLHPSDRHPGRR